MSASNGRIIKNAFLLCFRLIFLTVINLYAVRITFEALGAVDYGIYDVIASLVASISILTGAMTSASQRYLSYHLGKKDYGQYSQTFTLLLVSFLVIAFILIIVGEVLGFFFIDRWLTIPPDSVSAANWVFQTSLMSFAFGFVTIPYMSSIIANERMDAFAIFSVVEGALKLLAAFLLLHYSGDRLKLYGILVAFITICVFLMQMQYCHSNFKYCRYVWRWDRRIFADLSQYTGWNLFGSLSSILTNSGQNILLNIYFGPIINASKAIADKIKNVINGFSTNLYLAVSPQMVKSYAEENYQRSLNLVLKSSKFSFMLIFVMAFPLLCNMSSILEAWLDSDSSVAYLVEFCKLILLYCLVLTLEPPITSIIQATGDIKRYQIWVGIVTLSYLPISAVVLSLGATPVSTLVVLIIVMAIAQIVRVFIAHSQVGLSYTLYFRTIMIPILKVCVVALPVYWVIMEWEIMGFWTGLAIKLTASAIFGITMVALLGLDRSDWSMISGLVKSKIKYFHNKGTRSY